MLMTPIIFERISMQQYILLKKSMFFLIMNLRISWLGFLIKSIQMFIKN